jgi:two-component system response regulator AtoC
MGDSSTPREGGTAALLVAIDDAAAQVLGAALAERRIGVRRAASVPSALKEIHFENIALVLTGADDELAALSESSLDVPVVAVLDEADEDRASAALRAGAVAVVGPGLAEEEVRLALDRALGGAAGPPLSEEAPPPAKPGSLLGSSEPMRRVLELIDRTAPVLATVLVRGETGTGKELVARALHEKSPRRDGPFVTVHCAALPDALLESELFGYEKGAFTGATTRKPGRVELAEGGTLFLDEIGEITPATQVKLLRLLQEKRYERLGGVQSLKADVRFVAATHRDLEGMVQKGEFREDLFYRLNVVTIWLPPLRARRDDISTLAVEFARRFAAEYGKQGVRLDDTAIQALRTERWPGNVRQLQNFIERLVVLSTNGAIDAGDVRREMTAHVEFKTQLTGAFARVPDADTAAPPSSRAVPLGEAVKHAERAAIERALRQAGGNRTVAARILGVSRATLYAKLEEHVIR